MKVFVTGVNGQLGYEVAKELVLRGYFTIGSDINEKFCKEDTFITQELFKYVQLDITHSDKVENILSKEKPDAVIHCAAWTAVDDAEDETNKDKVYSINVLGTKNIASICSQLDIKMMYLSTDYVFNGHGTQPWKPEDTSYEPLNYYGETKLTGENIIKEYLKKFFIVRISWLFGSNGKNFIKTIINVGKNKDEVKVVCDQIGTPTYASDLTRLLIDMIETEKYGIYHATNEGGYISWYDLTCEIFKLAGISTKVTPVTTEEYGLNKAARPYNSRLDKTKLYENGFAPLPDWKNAVKRYIEQIDE